MAKSNNQIIFGLGILGIATAVFASTSKTKKAPSVATKPIIIDCTNPSIKIVDETKANQLLFDVAQQYAGTIKDASEASYITLTGNVLKKLNSNCYKLYTDQNFKSKELILILAYLSISVQNAFKMAYFGDIITLQDVDVLPEIKDDYEIWKTFRDITNPEKVEEFQKYIGYSSDMDAELDKIKQVIEEHDQYPKP